ncbi:4-(cytidine 5'-diphospho)-2-C-methyl-D-erythritol kinase [Comamonas flocculans]|uniref:4-diphosphocytidyl-2-C-methyl-D-erythritol kinase n=1 Tax=Comamonas flocculans TaxID=2597701 RepID=A0A5B8RWB3_9BURK|nr:4-(cytidine 5'-diphospho)-2-C-methyl-D-erythritol kinase [Comamonas flocculans]QEA13919.1 4-(cytidine 5'-diphospho)-2-C-methyl-D-erythritol kinase [Comamonas flocculans]
MRSLHDLPAPAKLNLFLHVLGRRSDGYHLLQSAFMLLDWCDLLHVECRASARLSREDLGSTALPEDDLCLRAARALQQASGCTKGAHITLEKRLPTQAGLGGGSSDAATTLLALNRLWQLDLPRSTLARIALALGADVPFFILGQNAWAEGVGEALTPLPPQAVQAGTRFVVVKPAAGLETARIFSDPSLRRDTQAATIAGFVAEQARSAFGFGRNDLQPVAQRLCPEVAQALHWLASRGLSGRMTGSGSAVFAVTKDTIDVSDAPAHWSIKVCQNLGFHPLAEWVRDE